jgi:hypothetical protein
MIAALAILGAALCAYAQTQGNAVKQNRREASTTTKATTPDEKVSATADNAIYTYEFEQPQFYIRHIIIKHDATGHGEIAFERQGDTEPLVDPLELSESARNRIINLWETLRFLDSSENYQSERQYPNMGTMRLKMKRGTQERVAEFNWTNNPNAKLLTDEYRRASNQAIFVFDISVARQNQPLDSPKILDRLESYISRNEISDPKQLIPLLRDLNTDERLPLIARNHAERILKKLEK